MVNPGPTTLVTQLVTTSGRVVAVLRDQVASDTAGTRSEHVHGCVDHVGNPIAPIAAIPLVYAADDDADNAGTAAVVEVVSIDDEVVVVKSDTEDAEFDLLVIY